MMVSIRSLHRDKLTRTEPLIIQRGWRGIIYFPHWRIWKKTLRT